MNTNHLKKFAQEARRKLLEQVVAKLNFVLTTDSAELREKSEQLKQLRQELGRIPKEQLIEKVAYTWFNRLMALRFMDVNDYEPLGIRIITPKEGYTIPELLDEAKRGNIPEELKLNRQKIYDLLDNKIPSSNPQNEAFRELLISACNHLHTTFPFLFEKINDYTELLLPDDLTSDFSIVKNVQDGMSKEDCQNVEIIGWLYQFYISEEKERLINAKKRYKASEIAPVTQLFTPKWLVQYMVDNTLGLLWKEARPNTKILIDLAFYIKPKNESLIPRREIKSPEEISFFDPCVGSAHILCYAFDIFFKIYEEEGYSNDEIPKLIITKNLYGVDIDERAAQLAAFALMMKGLQYSRRFLKTGIHPNIIAFQNSDLHPKFKYAKTHGSLIKITKIEVDNIKIDENSIFAHEQRHLKRQASFLANKYDITVTNPPYMSSSYMENELKEYVEKEYYSTKTDLFACFLNQVRDLTHTNGLIGFISPSVWMFNSSFKRLRDHIINTSTITTLVQLEYNAFEPAVVPIASFTLRNILLDNYYGSYIKLSDFKGHNIQAPKTIEAIQNQECGWFFTSNQSNFKKIPDYPIGYWLSENLIQLFANKTVSDYFTVRHGILTGNDNRFLRIWNEVSVSQIGLNDTLNDYIRQSKPFYPINKGGGIRKWYGFNTHILKLGNNEALFNNNKVKERHLFFLEGLTWSEINTNNLSCRYSPQGILFGHKGPMAFEKKDGNLLYYLLGFCNTKICAQLKEVINSSISFTSGNFEKIPIHIVDNETKGYIVDIVKSLITISKDDWDMHELSWDFCTNPLLSTKTNIDDELEFAYDSFCAAWNRYFFSMHHLEEKLNNHFIQKFNVQNEIKINISLEAVNILNDELEVKNLIKQNKKLIRDPNNNEVQNYHEIKLPFIASEIIAQFISYSVGCMLGRYSLDKEGLIMANQDETLVDYLHKIEKTKNECVFFPDEDNIIPLLGEDWFEDDIVGKFYQFLKVSFGEKNFNKNLAFIEEQIGKDIRKYFIKDFYTDHIKRYRKRPIYWMFSSSKGSFNALIYMHRYTPDTVSNILNKYLKEFIGKLNTRKEHLERVKETGSVSDKSKAIKESDNIQKMLVELHEYERDILYPLAIERIEIDLDDGVLVNYNKFGKAVKEVNGLNDPATKKKVKQFDWIDTAQIR